MPFCQEVLCVFHDTLVGSEEVHALVVLEYRCVEFNVIEGFAIGFIDHLDDEPL